MACPCGASGALDGLCDDCAGAAIQDLATANPNGDQ